MNETHIHEHRAPTEESLKLLIQIQKDVQKNLITHFKVDDNLISAECFCWEIVASMGLYLVFIKLLINGKEVLIEKKVSVRDLGMVDGLNIGRLHEKLHSYSRSVLLWWVIKHFREVAYTQITGEKPPKYLEL